MDTITIEVNKQSNEWTKLASFVESIGLTIKEKNFETKKAVRVGWAEAAKKMHELGDDQLLFDDVFEDELQFPSLRI